MSAQSVGVARRGRGPGATAFAAWLLVGALCALGVAGVMTIGIIVLPAGLLLAVLLSTRHSWRPGWPGLMAGAALAPLYIAYLNRGGPGEVCQSSGGGSSCVQAWSPAPFVAIAVLMLALSAVALVLGPRPTATR